MGILTWGCLTWKRKTPYELHTGDPAEQRGQKETLPLLLTWPRGFWVWGWETLQLQDFWRSVKRLDRPHIVCSKISRKHDITPFNMRYSMQVLGKRSAFVLIFLSHPKVWKDCPCFTDGKQTESCLVHCSSVPASSLPQHPASLLGGSSREHSRSVLFHNADNADNVRRGAEMEEEATTQPARSPESIPAISGVTDVTTNHPHFLLFDIFF